MLTVSANWKFNLDKAFASEIEALAAGGFDLVAIAATIYIRDVYWSTPSLKAPEVTKKLHSAMERLGYGKSSKYDLANAALAIARNWVKRFGSPVKDASERNVFWSTMLQCVTLKDFKAFSVAAIKADYGSTMKDVYATLNPAKATVTANKELPERVKAALEKGDAGDASKAALIAMPFLEGGDKIAALASIVDHLDRKALQQAFELVNARMAMIAEEDARVKAEAKAKAA